MSDLRLQADVRIEQSVVRVLTYDVTQRAGVLDLAINQGQDFRLVVEWWDAVGNAPHVLTGHAVKLRAREQFDSEDLALDISALLQNGDREALFALSAAQTAELTFVSAVYEIEAVSGGGTRTRLLQGRAVLWPGVLA